MNVIYVLDELPSVIEKSIFLAGPVPRSTGVRSWRIDALQLLDASGYDGLVFVPEPRDVDMSIDYKLQIEWEEHCLNVADCILFWVPRDLVTLPAFTTNLEFGVWHDSGKAIFGAPKEAPKNTYLRHYAQKYDVPTATSLDKTIAAALTLIGEGSARSAGERMVPLLIWRTIEFQSWYKSQVQVGHCLRSARVQWVLSGGQTSYYSFRWALLVELEVSSGAVCSEFIIAGSNMETICIPIESNKHIDPRTE